MRTIWFCTGCFVNKGFWKRIVDIQSDQFREMRIDKFLIEDYPISAKVQERCLLWGARVIATSVYLLSSKISASSRQEHFPRVTETR